MSVSDAFVDRLHRLSASHRGNPMWKSSFEASD